MKKNILIITSVSILFILIIACVITWRVTVNYPWENLIIEEAEKNINGKLVIGNFTFNTGEARLKNVKILSMEGNEILAVEEIQVSYSIGKYLKTREPFSCIKSVEIKNPLIKAEYVGDEKWNFQEIIKSKKEESKKIEIIPFNGDIKISGGEILVSSKDPNLLLDMDIKNINAKAGFWANPEINFSLEAEEKTSLIALKGKSNYTTPNIFASGEISDIDISRWAKLVKVDGLDITGGIVNAKGGVSLVPWKEGKFLFSGEGLLNLKNGSLTYNKEANVDLTDINGEISLKNNRIEILGLEGKKDNDLFTLKGKIFSFKEPRLSVSLDCPDWDLKNIEKNLKEKVPEIEDYPLEGKASIRLLIDGSLKKPFLMTEISSDSLKVKGEEFKNLSLKGSFLEKNIHIKEFHTDCQGGNISLSGYIGNISDSPEMNIESHIQGFNPAIIEKFVPELKKHRLTGNINMTANIFGDLNNPAIFSHIHSSSAGAMGVSLENINSHIIYYDQSVNIPVLEAYLGGGPVDISGHILNVKNPLFGLYIDAENVDIDSIKGAVPQIGDIYGKVNLKAELLGQEKNIAARGLIYDSTAGTMGEELKSIKAGFDYGGNTLSLYNIYALWNSSPIVGRGIINTDINTIDLYIKSPQIEMANLEKFYPEADKIIAGDTIKLDLLVRGFTNDPIVTARAKIPAMNLDKYYLKEVDLIAYYRNNNLWVPELNSNISTSGKYKITEKTIEKLELEKDINTENLAALIDKEMTEKELTEQLKELEFSEENIKAILAVAPFSVKNNANIAIGGFFTNSSEGWIGKASLKSNGIWEGISYEEIEGMVYLSQAEERAYIDYMKIKKIGDEGELSLKGHLEKDKMSLFCWGENVDLQLTEKFIKLPEKLYGKATLNSIITGTYKNPQLTGTLLIDGGEFGDIDFSVHSDFEIKNKILSLSNLSILEKDSVYKFKGEMELESPWKFSLESQISGADILEFEKFYPLIKEIGIKGKVNGDVNIEGTLDKVTDLESAIKDFNLSGNLSLYRGKFKRLNIEELDMEFSLEKEKISLSGLTLKTKDTTIQAKGSYDQKNNEIDLSFSSSDFNLKDLERVTDNLTFRGQGQFRGTVEGKLNKLKGWADFQVTSPNINNYAIDKAEGIIKFDNEKANRLKVENISLKKDKDTYKVAGYIDIKPDPELFLSLSATEVGLQNMLDIAKIQPAFPLNGEITTMTHLRGTVKKPVISNNLKAENININGFNIENATGEFYLTPEKFHIGTLSINSGDMSVEGKGYLEKDKDTDLSLEGNNISIDLIEKIFIPDASLDLEGDLDFNLEAKGPTKELDLIGSFQIRDALINNNKLSRVRSLFSYNGKVLNIQDLRLVEKDLNITGKGTVPVEWEGEKFIAPSPMDISITTNSTDLKLISIFDSDFDGTEGLIDSEFHIGGILFSPEIKGHVKVDNGIIYHKISKEPFKNLSFLINITNEAINLESLEGVLGEGTFKANGDLHLENFKPQEVSFNFTGDNLLLDLPDFFRTTVSLSGTLENNISRPLLKGNILLDDYNAEIYPAILSSDDDKKLGKKSLADKIKDAFPALEPQYEYNKDETAAANTQGSTKLPLIDLDVDLKAGMGYWVKTTISRMKASGELKLSGNTQKPDITGVIDIPQGYINLLSTGLEIRNSYISFNKGTGIIPYVLLEGNTILSGRSISVTISGLADHLKTELRSDPPLPQQDVLALLSPTSAENSDFNSQDILENTYQAILSGAVSSFVLNPIEETLGKGLGLDVFSVNITPEGNIGLEVGKNLTERIRISYRIYNKDELEQLNRSTYELERDVLTLEYKINRYTTFDIGTNTSGGLVTRIKIDYRF